MTTNYWKLRYRIKNSCFSNTSFKNILLFYIFLLKYLHKKFLWGTIISSLVIIIYDYCTYYSTHITLIFCSIRSGFKTDERNSEETRGVVYREIALRHHLCPIDPWMQNNLSYLGPIQTLLIRNRHLPPVNMNTLFLKLNTHFYNLLDGITPNRWYTILSWILTYNIGSSFGGLLEYSAWKSNGLSQCAMFQHSSSYPSFLPVSAGMY